MMTQRGLRRADTGNVTENCPRCSYETLVVEGYRDVHTARLMLRAFCTSCGFMWTETRGQPVAEAAG